MKKLVITMIAIIAVVCIVIGIAIAVQKQEDNPDPNGETTGTEEVITPGETSNTEAPDNTDESTGTAETTEGSETTGGGEVTTDPNEDNTTGGDEDVTTDPSQGGSVGEVFVPDRKYEKETLAYDNTSAGDDLLSMLEAEQNIVKIVDGKLTVDLSQTPWQDVNDISSDKLVGFAYMKKTADSTAYKDGDIVKPICTTYENDEFGVYFQDFYSAFFSYGPVGTTSYDQSVLSQNCVDTRIGQGLYYVEGFGNLEQVQGDFIGLIFQSSTGYYLVVVKTSASWKYFALACDTHYLLMLLKLV